MAVELTGTALAVVGWGTPAGVYPRWLRCLRILLLVNVEPRVSPLVARPWAVLRPCEYPRCAVAAWSPTCPPATRSRFNGAELALAAALASMRTRLRLLLERSMRGGDGSSVVDAANAARCCANRCCDDVPPAMPPAPAPAPAPDTGEAGTLRPE